MKDPDIHYNDSYLSLVSPHTALKRKKHAKRKKRTQKAIKKEKHHWHPSAQTKRQNNK